MQTVADMRGVGVKNKGKFADVLCGRPLTLFQLRGTDYAHVITTGTPRFSDLPTALDMQEKKLATSR